MLRTPTRIAAPLLGLMTGLMFALGPVSVDLSLPALPAMRETLGGPAVRVELTLTLLFFGLALTQLIYGAVADRYGRRRPLLVGLALYTLASVMGLFATHLSAIAAIRAVQALGYGVVIVLIRSVVADVCKEQVAARVFSVAITLMSVAAVIAPAAGSALLALHGWRMVFLTMTVFGALSLLLAATTLPETQPPAARSVTPFSHSLTVYWALLCTPRFAVFAFIAAAAVACQFSYNTAGPALLIEHYGLTPGRAGMLLSLIALSTAGAAQLNVLLLRRMQPESVLWAAAVVLLAAATLLLLVTAGRVGGVALCASALFVLVSAPGFIVANAMAAGITGAGERAGAASALIGVLQFLLGTLGSAVVGYYHDNTGAVLGIVAMTFATVAFGIAWFGRRQMSPAPQPGA